MLSRRHYLASTAALAATGLLAACAPSKSASADSTAQAPLATLEPTPTWSVDMKAATVADFHPRLGTLLSTPGTGKATLTAVNPDGNVGWKADVDTAKPSDLEAAWIAADGADCVAAYDKDSATLIVWQATSTKAVITQDKVTDARLGAAGLLAIVDGGGIKTLTLTGGIIPHLTDLSAPGTPLAASTDGHYLTMNADDVLCLDGTVLAEAGQGVPKATTLTASVAAAAWDDVTVVWTTDGTRVAKADSAAVFPQRRPITGGQWAAWGGLAWVYGGDQVPLDSPAAAILDGGAYEASEGGCTVIDLGGGATVTSGKVTPVGAPVAADHLVTFDGTTVASWPLRAIATPTPSTEA